MLTTAVVTCVGDESFTDLLYDGYSEVKRPKDARRFSKMKVQVKRVSLLPRSRTEIQERLERFVVHFALSNFSIT
jgi:hypothetical protein